MAGEGEETVAGDGKEVRLAIAKKHVPPLPPSFPPSLPPSILSSLPPSSDLERPLQGAELARAEIHGGGALRTGGNYQATAGRKGVTARQLQGGKEQLPSECTE